MKSRDRWKAVEREFAEIIGGKRVPVSGRQRGDQPDIEHPLFSVEVKAGERAISAAKLRQALAQARAAAVGTDKTPLVLLSHSRQGVKAERYAVMDIDDFVAWFGTHVGVAQE